MSAPSRNRAAGVLPVNAAATKKSTQAQGARGSGQRAPAPRLRLIIRRLPPGLLEAEFWAAMGEEWQVGKGKIDWAAFKDGKVSKDPAKPSRPARAYLKVKDQAQLDALSTKIKVTTFQDAKNTSKDLCLLGPPSVEFAPYNKMATARVRHDGRQGTIDQDQEFIDFLQSLTEPITKPANGTEADASQEKVTTTPLVQYLKEKKANKAKEAAEKKSAKQKEAKESKDKKEKASAVVVKGSTPAAEKARVAKATQDAVKAINKSVASMQTPKPASPGAKPEVKGTPAKETPAPAPASPAKKERERGNASAAARMLQRDLGLAPRSPRAARPAPASPSITKAESATPADKTEATSAPAQDQRPANTTATPPTGPRNARIPSTTTPKPAPVPTARPSKPLPNPSANAKSAFLKHANPSQGVTEELLRIAFEAFGNLTRCEIDKKKGLGYIDFEETESLKKAMHASPVKVGNGTVVVLENRNLKKPTPFAKASTATATTAESASASPVMSKAEPTKAADTPAPTDTPTASTAVTGPAAAATTTADTPASPAPSAATTATTTAPTAPRGAARGPRGGSMRGNPTPRGNFGPGPRAGPRGGFRAGRGSFGPRGGRAAAQAVAANNAGQTSAGAAPASQAAAVSGGDGK